MDMDDTGEEQKQATVDDTSNNNASSRLKRMTYLFGTSVAMVVLSAIFLAWRIYLFTSSSGGGSGQISVLSNRGSSQVAASL
jgi:lipopolysaccharide/colanic/teichoic acid biosynthesis glycosyltransferase